MRRLILTSSAMLSTDVRETAPLPPVQKPAQVQVQVQVLRTPFHYRDYSPLMNSYRRWTRSCLPFWGGIRTNDLEDGRCDRLYRLGARTGGQSVERGREARAREIGLDTLEREN